RNISSRSPAPCACQLCGSSALILESNAADESRAVIHPPECPSAYSRGGNLSKQLVALRFSKSTQAQHRKRATPVENPLPAKHSQCFHPTCRDSGSRCRPSLARLRQASEIRFAAPDGSALPCTWLMRRVLLDRQ